MNTRTHIPGTTSGSVSCPRTHQDLWKSWGPPDPVSSGQAALTPELACEPYVYKIFEAVKILSMFMILQSIMFSLTKHYYVYARKLQILPVLNLRVLQFLKRFKIKVGISKTLSRMSGGKFPDSVRNTLFHMKQIQKLGRT